MAIIGKIRKHSGLAVIIVGVAIAAFVIGDFGKKRYRGTTDIGAVDGKSITYLDFNKQVEDAADNQKQNSGNEKLTEDDMYSIRQTVWATLVKDMVMEKELDALGMTVTPEELFDQVQGKHPHRYILQYFKDPKTGAYNPELVLNYLKNLDQMEPKAKTQWLQFEKAIKDDRIMTKFNNLFTKAYYVPKAFLGQEYLNEKQVLKIRTLSPRLDLIPDSTVHLTDADYQSFYDKNKPIFYQDEPMREIDYVVFDVLPSGADRQKIETDVAAIYKDFTVTTDIPDFVNANSDKKYDSTFVKKGTDLPLKIDSLCFISPVGTFFPPFEYAGAWYMAKILAIQDRPDTMKASQILISYTGTNLSQQDKNITRTKEQATQLADSLLAVLKKDPSKFKDLAKTLSDYPTAKQDAGDLKDIVDGEPGFAIFFNAGLTMKPEEIKIVHTSIGLAIFKLNSKTKPVRKVRVALVQRNIEPSNQTFQDTYMKASAFAGQNRTQEAFDKAAAAQGLQKKNAMNIRDMDMNITGLSPAREVVRWAFNENTKIGDISPIFDLTGKYVVAVLKGITDKGYIPLAKIKDRLEQSVKNQKKIELLAGRLTRSLQTSKDLYSLAAQYQTKVDTVNLTFAGYVPAAIGREAELIGQLFDDKPGEVVGPLTGKYGVFVVSVDDLIPPPQTEDYLQIANQLHANFANTVNTGLYEALRKSSNIKDERKNFY